MDLDGRGAGKNGGVEGWESVIRTYVRKKSTFSKRGEEKRKLRDSGGRLGPRDSVAVEDTHCTQPPTCLLHFLPRNFECEQLQMRLWIFPLCK